MFILIALSVWASLHAYVFWRLGSIPAIRQYASWRARLPLAVALWASFPLARYLLSNDWDTVGIPFSFLVMTWVGTLFLLFAFLLIVDTVTIGGLLFPSIARRLRLGAVIAALAASVFALVQGGREPVVREYDVHLPDLPASADGYTIVAISDLHLGTVLGDRWLTRVVKRIDAMNPRAVFIVGDLIDGDVDRVTPMIPTLKRLQAPDGVWSVTGNHELYAGLERSVDLMEEAGFSVLRDRSVELIPGLVLAGVEDASVRLKKDERPRIETAMTGVASNAATILLSHTPDQVPDAAAAGVDLMLSGHTHGGQIWPFNWIVRLRYPHIYGSYRIDRMELIVSRGAGTWGPRMRLWQRGEILRLRLRRM